MPMYLYIKASRTTYSNGIKREGEEIVVKGLPIGFKVRNISEGIVLINWRRINYNRYR